MGLACDHMNLVGLSSNNPAVFARSQSIMTGFFGQFLSGSITGLEAILGDEVPPPPADVSTGETQTELVVDAGARVLAVSRPTLSPRAAPFEPSEGVAEYKAAPEDIPAEGVRESKAQS